MKRRERPPRSWDVDMLFVLGKREGTKAKHLRAVPILILERWVQGGREEDVANYIWTKDIAKRLVDSGLVPPFKPKGTSVILASLTTIQKSRNLTRPKLLEYRGEGMFWVNLPHYEALLQEYRPKYRELYPEDYRKLFPDEEPDWGSPPFKEQTQHEQVKPALAESEVQDEIQSLLAPVEQALRDREEAVERLGEENKKLQAELAAMRIICQEGRVVPYRRIVDDELRNDCAELLENEKYYIDAIRRASVVLEQRLNEAVGTKAKERQYGASLVRYALAKDTGKLVVSEVPNEQDGVFQLFSGAIAFVRNPPAHKKVQYTELEAWQTISLIDYLLLLLRQAKSRES